MGTIARLSDFLLTYLELVLNDKCWFGFLEDVTFFFVF